MRRVIRTVFWLGLLFVVLTVGYGYLGYRDARDQGRVLAQEANALIKNGLGGVALGIDRRAMLLAVEDPAFGSHYGVDFTTPGAGAYTITQSLAAPYGFADFTPGLRRIRQSGFALGLEVVLTKPQILALFLDRVPMGPAPNGTYLQGFNTASQLHYGAAPGDIPREDFVRMIAVIIAPTRIRLDTPEDPELIERVARIEALLQTQCVPNGHGDVWFEACAR